MEDIWFLLTIVMDFCCIYADKINLAVNKPAYQISNYAPSHGQASAAVDGQTSSVYAIGAGCTLTQDNQFNPWWAVDLEEDVRLTNVRIINRSDQVSERLHDFQVGVTITHPNTQAPNVNNYALCATYNGIADPGWNNISCTSNLNPGRYVIIQIVGNSDTLTLCEVQVFGEKIFQQFQMIPEEKLIGHVIETKIHRNVLGCVRRCLRHDYCRSVNVMEDSTNSRIVCELNSYSVDPTDERKKWNFIQL